MWWDRRLNSVYFVTLEVDVCTLMSAVCFYFYQQVFLSMAKCGVSVSQMLMNDAVIFSGFSQFTVFSSTSLLYR